MVLGGKPSGPYSREELRTLPIGPDTFVKAEGMGDYKEIREMKDLSAFLGFDHVAIPAPQYYASPDVRMLAVVIDYLLVFGFYIVLLLVVLSFVTSEYLKVALSVTTLPLIPLTKLTLGVFMECSSRQGTFGKSWLGIKVTDEKGRRISFFRSLARNAFKIVPILTLGIGYLTGFFNQKQQCLHDLMARTVVIKDRLTN